MTLELDMTLAEALVERKGLKERLDNLKQRLAVNARVQEGDTPTETPQALLEQVDAAIAGLAPDGCGQSHQPDGSTAWRRGLELDGGDRPARHADLAPDHPAGDD
jgi:hypothetical protein